MDIIWDLKRRYYCSEENEDISRQEVQIEGIRTRIQQYMISKGFPEEWAPEEYTSYFEKIFGTDKERQRRYLSGILAEDKATLSVGNRVLGAFLSSELTRVVFTTNFDSIVEKSVAEVSGNSISAYHLEGAHSAVQALNNEEYPIYCKLHGDFRYDSIKNLTEDLSNQNHDLSECMKVASSRFGFIVAGYSGRDASIIALFKEALEGHNPFPHGLYWTGIKGSRAPSVVKELIEFALSKGVKAAYVEVETFDSLMLRLWRNTPNKKHGLDEKVRKFEVTEVSIPLGNPGGGKPLLRLNALPLTEIPTTCNSLTFDSPKQWSDLKDAQRKAEGRLLLTKAEKVLCWGTESDIRANFQDVRAIEPFDFNALLENLEDNLYIKGIIEEALSKAIVNGKPLISRTNKQNSFVIVDTYTEDQSVFNELKNVVGQVYGKIPGLQTKIDQFHDTSEPVFWAEALRVSFERKENRNWLLIDPDIWIWPSRARHLAVDFLDQRRSDRYNKKYNEILNAWTHLILGTDAKNISVSFSAFMSGEKAENPSFSINTRTGFSQRALSK
ncbi:SIR2-like domain-containing protein [Methylophilus rhizosphaerae]|uniref:SIR2-like domain-containing protein n=1 Tax=Methylophilus rhizosphaerae TaxID=492660 RepID=A0A1G9CNW1_9PROT|nr:SIR2 family protein [Methylophilus rhizosphaerae]SDK53266.1 SIR2-like domain-containing protein [Methylophilus rhizosphaerae]